MTGSPAVQEGIKGRSVALQLQKQNGGAAAAAAMEALVEAIIYRNANRRTMCKESEVCRDS